MKFSKSSLEAASCHMVSEKGAGVVERRMGGDDLGSMASEKGVCCRRWLLFCT